MTRQTLILIYLVLFCLSPALPGCNNSDAHNVELEELKTALEKTESERDNLKTKADTTTRERDKLKKKVDELITSRGELEMQINALAAARDSIQKQFGELTASRNQWQKQLDELTKAKDQALVTNQDAQTQIDDLKNRLQAETQKVARLENQLKQVQAAVKGLQEKLSF